MKSLALIASASVAQFGANLYDAATRSGSRSGQSNPGIQRQGSKNGRLGSRSCRFREEGGAFMAASKFHSSLMGFIPPASALAHATEADALLLLIDDEVLFDEILAVASLPRLIVATSDEKIVAEAVARQVACVPLKMTLDDAAVNERLTQAVLESVADELLKPGASVVAIYSAFEDEKVDSISTIRLTEHLGRLTARDLQRLETQVPLETLKSVVDLAIEIGREGREGKPVGALFVVGDHRKVMAQSHNACFDFVKGYQRKERSLFDPKVREGLKELAQLDGAFVIASDGIVEGSCRIIDTAPVEITLTTGLGARHWAAAAITRNTHAVSVAVSESSGTVRIFLNGEVVLRIEPMRRAMKWREFDSEPAVPKPPQAAPNP